MKMVFKAGKGKPKIKVKMIAEKLIGTEIEGKYTTRKYHVLKLVEKEVSLVLWWAERLWSESVDGDLDYVDIDLLLDAIEDRDYVWFYKGEILTEEAKQYAKTCILEKYRGYILHIKRR